MAIFTSRTFPNLRNGVVLDQFSQILGSKLTNMENSDDPSALDLNSIPLSNPSISDNDDTFLSHKNSPDFSIKISPFIDNPSSDLANSFDALQPNPNKRHARSANKDNTHNFSGAFFGFSYYLGWVSIVIEGFVLTLHSIAYRIILKNAHEHDVVPLV